MTPAEERRAASDPAQASGREKDGLLARIRGALLRPRGERKWDAVVRGSGAAGLAGLGLMWLLPAAGPLVGLAIFTLWVTGPLSPLFPVGLEPVLMVFGRLYEPWLVAAVCMAAGVYIEFVGYHLYGYVAARDVAEPVRESRVVRWARDLFDRRPFLATWFCAWSPVPFWVVRFLAPMSDYPMGRFLAATVLGRYPKLWLFAYLGVWWSVSDEVLFAVAAACLLIGPALWAWRRARRGEAKADRGAGAGEAGSADDGAGGGPGEDGWGDDDHGGGGGVRGNGTRPPAPVPAGGRTRPVEVLYIAGIGRSGSTLLGRTLGGHPDHVAVGEVMRLYGRGMADDEICSCGEPARSCAFWGRVIEELEARTGLDREAAADFSRLRRRMTEGAGTLATLSPWTPGAVRGRLARLRSLLLPTYRSLREVSGAEVLVDASKNLAWGRLLVGTPGLEVRVLHLVRDSRGVAHSFSKVKRRPGARGEDAFLARYGPLTTSLLWNADNLLAERLGRRAADYRRLRYRDFVRSPRGVSRHVLGNGTRPPPAPHVDGRTVDVGGQHILAGNPVRFENGRVALEEDLAWRQSMGRGRRALVTALTGPLMLRYGYLGGEAAAAPDSAPEEATRAPEPAAPGALHRADPGP